MTSYHFTVVNPLMGWILKRRGAVAQIEPYLRISPNATKRINRDFQ